jgi:alpha-L-fucosidase 2
VPTKVKVYAEKAGVLRIKLPFKTYVVRDMPAGSVKMGDDGIAEVNLEKKQTIVFENGYE